LAKKHTKTKNLIDIEITEGTITIGRSTFQERKDIQTIIIPNSIEAIKSLYMTIAKTLRPSEFQIKSLTQQTSFLGSERLCDAILPNNLENI